MWSLGHTLREVERSHSRVVFEETATTGAVWISAVPSLPLVLVFRNTASVIVSLGFASFALYASVSSKFIADRSRREFTIERRIAFWTMRRVYQTAMIDRMYVISTQKGDGLGMRFKSGKKKMLTMSLGADYQALDSASIALNAFVYTPRGKERGA